MNQKISFHPRLKPSDTARPEAAAPPTCVSEIMTMNVVTLSPNQTFAEAVSLMANRPFRHFLVVHSDGELAGVISDRDLLRVLSRTPVWQSKLVCEFMNRDVVIVHPDTPLSLAVGELLARRINCLPVVDERKRVCGIITSTDLLTAYQRIQASVERVSR